ncbi:MAG: ribosomal protein S18-alanine N-acetyltransferase [Paracoccus sp. (in: a-proteobacteria)]
MTLGDLATIHASCFTHPRPWGSTEFTELLTDPANFLITRQQAFVLGRSVLDEAELLTIAVSPEARRRGLGHTLLAAFETMAMSRNAITAFLEVAADNIPALTLYDQAGWQSAGCRRNYYGHGTDAVVMCKNLQAASSLGKPR